MSLFSKKYGFISIGVCIKGIYFHLSPNGHKWASTFYLGPDKEERIRAKVRKAVFGHNYEVHGWNEEHKAYNYDVLVAINELVSIDYDKYIFYRKKLFDHSSK